jgi:hypothetical protein
MSKQEEAALILQLYELRREEILRKARGWFVREFNPESIADFMSVATGERGDYLRMVVSYWDMAAALVNEGAIGLQLFDKTNAEHVVIFCKIEKLLPEIRANYALNFARNLETLIDAIPDGRKRVTIMRDRLAALRLQPPKP